MSSDRNGSYYGHCDKMVGFAGHHLPPERHPLLLKHTFTAIIALAIVTAAAAAHAQGPLDSLATPQEGRSMRASSTFRRGADGKYDPNADPEGDNNESSNSDNFRVAPGKTHVIMDVKGPGVITHIWLTFLGPEPQ